MRHIRSVGDPGCPKRDVGQQDNFLRAGIRVGQPGRHSYDDQEMVRAKIRQRKGRESMEDHTWNILDSLL